MKRVLLRAAAGFLLGVALVALPVWAEEPKPAASKPPDFSGYVFVADVVGEVVKADDKAVTLRITWFEPQIKGGGNNKNARPKLSQNNRNFRNPFAQNMNRPQQPQVQFKEHHHDYVLEYLPQSLVRAKVLPPKMDEKGKRVAYTQKEIDEYRAPAGVTGYAAERFDLKPGTILEVILVRDKTVPAAKAGEDDLRIKYAIIQGQDPNPPKDIANSGKDKEKKKKD
ncbi:MAG: protein BatD [Planctomycetes bacterium]|nr:protein BatD [Planctomycetota bacterium]